MKSNAEYRGYLYNTNKMRIEFGIHWKQLFIPCKHSKQLKLVFWNVCMLCLNGYGKNITTLTVSEFIFNYIQMIFTMPNDHESHWANPIYLGI